MFVYVCVCMTCITAWLLQNTRSFTIILQANQNRHAYLTIPSISSQLWWSAWSDSNWQSLLEHLTKRITCEIKWQPIKIWKKRTMNIWHDSTKIACRKCMLAWHHCKTITFLKCSNSLPSSSSESSTDGSKLPGEGKFPASSTYSFYGVNVVTMQIFKVVHTRKLSPLANEQQDWCMFLPKRMAGWEIWISFNKKFDRPILVPAHIDLHEYIKVTAHEKKDCLIR